MFHPNPRTHCTRITSKDSDLKSATRDQTHWLRRNDENCSWMATPCEVYEMDKWPERFRAEARNVRAWAGAKRRPRNGQSNESTGL